MIMTPIRKATSKTKKVRKTPPVTDMVKAIRLATELVQGVCQCGHLDSEHMSPYNRDGVPQGACNPFDERCACMRFKSAKLFVCDSIDMELHRGE